MRTWRPTGVSCVITDPPYVTGDALDLYTALADFALDVLPDGAPLVVMTDIVRLPGVLRAMDRPPLVYRATLAWTFSDRVHGRDFPRLLFPAWKPVLVYHAGHWQDAQWLYTEVESRRPLKNLHEWEQDVSGFAKLVSYFTKPGDTVCDPFLGSGTTAVAAISTGRRFIGADIDADAIATARRRFAS